MLYRRWKLPLELSPDPNEQASDRGKDCELSRLGGLPSTCSCQLWCIPVPSLVQVQRKVHPSSFKVGALLPHPAGSSHAGERCEAEVDIWRAVREGLTSINIIQLYPPVPLDLHLIDPLATLYTQPRETVQPRLPTHLTPGLNRRAPNMRKQHHPLLLDEGMIRADVGFARGDV
jgi:hypothetical protein